MAIPGRQTRPSTTHMETSRDTTMSITASSRPHSETRRRVTQGVVFVTPLRPPDWPLHPEPWPTNPFLVVALSFPAASVSLVPVSTCFTATCDTAGQPRCQRPERLGKAIKEDAVRRLQQQLTRPRHRIPFIHARFTQGSYPSTHYTIKMKFSVLAIATLALSAESVLADYHEDYPAEPPRLRPSRARRRRCPPPG
jgi:hypothetical protein